MAKQTEDTKTAELELTLTLTKAQAKTLSQSVQTQLKSVERAARAERIKGREAIADALDSEQQRLISLLAQLGH